MLYEVITFEEEPGTLFKDCRQAVNREKLRRKRQELHERIKNAEASGAMQELAAP